MVVILRNNPKLGKITNFNVIFLVMGFIFQLNLNLKHVPSLHLKKIGTGILCGVYFSPLIFQAEILTYREFYSFQERYSHHPRLCFSRRKENRHWLKAWLTYLWRVTLRIVSTIPYKRTLNSSNVSVEYLYVRFLSIISDTHKKTRVFFNEKSPWTFVIWGNKNLLFSEKIKMPFCSIKDTAINRTFGKQLLVNPGNMISFSKNFCHLYSA